jgi:hypothetical protein
LPNSLAALIRAFHHVALSTHREAYLDARSFCNGKMRPALRAAAVAAFKAIGHFPSAIQVRSKKVAKYNRFGFDVR